MTRAQKREKRRAKKKKSLCMKCGKVKFLTRHHIVPKRLRTSFAGILMCCRDCHDTIEDEIRKSEYEILKRHLHIYWNVVKPYRR